MHSLKYVLLSGYNTDHRGPGSLKHSLCGPLQKTCAGPWSTGPTRERRNYRKRGVVAKAIVSKVTWKMRVAHRGVLTNACMDSQTEEQERVPPKLFRSYVTVQQETARTAGWLTCRVGTVEAGSCRDGSRWVDGAR